MADGVITSGDPESASTWNLSPEMDNAVFLEMVAVGIWRQRCDDVYRSQGVILLPWEAETTQLREDVRSEAKAAIRAMRTPTTAMLLAAAPMYDDNWRPTHVRHDTNMEAIWQAMIDAVLVDG